MIDETLTTDEAWVAGLKQRLESSTPEGVVADLAKLVSMRAEFKHEKLYQDLLDLMAGKLFLKCLRREK